MSEKITIEDVNALLLDSDGNQRTQVDIAARLGVSVATVRRVRAATREQMPRHAPKADREAKMVYDAIARHISEHMWAPSQRDLSTTTGLTLSRVNYLLQYMRGQGLIELGPNPREIRIVGSSMVIPQVTL